VSVLKSPVQLHAKKNAHRLSFREKRKGCPATGQPSLSRENSSNGAFIHQNFLPESYEPENRGVKQNFLIKYYYFQQLTGCVHKSANRTKTE
jgi:hypothetical protein